MAKRQSNKRRLYKYSIGDMRTRISFYDRDIKSVSFSSNFAESYTNELKKWAAVESVKPYHLFNEVNIDENPITHKFIIRYDSIITSEKVIKYDENIYKIVNIEDPELRKQFMIIYAALEGNENKEANK